jgi:hypothetical protein
LVFVDGDASFIATDGAAVVP